MVPLKKREQIWRGEFVELSTLEDEEPDDILFNIKTGKVTSASSKKKFLTIEQWTDAFSIYASVYRTKFPEEAEALASYRSLDRRIAAEGGGWYNYDRQFRKLKANSTITQYKWDQREDELFFLALNRRQLFRPEIKISGKSKQNKSKHLSCFKYDKGRNCTGCQYPIYAGTVAASTPCSSVGSEMENLRPSPGGVAFFPILIAGPHSRVSSDKGVKANQVRSLMGEQLDNNITVEERLPTFVIVDRLAEF